MQTDWKINVAMVDSMGAHFIMLCTPWGLTWLQDGIQYVTLATEIGHNYTTRVWQNSTLV